METSEDEVFSASGKVNVLPEKTPNSVKDNPEPTDDGDSDKEDPFTPKEGGYGWFVCVTVTWCLGTTFGIINIFGIMYVFLRDKYEHKETDISFKTSLIGSLALGMSLFMSLPASIAIDKLGIRKTAFLGASLSVIGMVSSAFVENISLYYLTFSILFGIGASFTNNPAIFVLGHYFKKRLGLVNGLVAFGVSLFSVALSLSLPLLLEKVGLRWTFLTLAGMWCVSLLGTLTWKPQFESDVDISKRDKKCRCQWISKYVNFKIWKKNTYVVWVISCTIFGMGYFTPFVHLTKHCEDRFPDYDSSLMVLCINIGSGVSRLLSGRISDWLSKYIIQLHQCAIGLYGLLTILVPVVTNYYGLIVVALSLGVADGMFLSILSPIVFHILGPKGAAQGMGFYWTVATLPFTVGPALTGLMYDKFGSYQIAFHVVGCSGILAFLILCFINRKPCRKQNRSYAP